MSKALKYNKYLFMAESHMHLGGKRRLGWPVRSATVMFRAAQREKWQVVMQDTRGNHEIR